MPAVRKEVEGWFLLLFTGSLVIGVLAIGYLFGQMLMSPQSTASASASLAPAPVGVPPDPVPNDQRETVPATVPNYTFEIARNQSTPWVEVPQGWNLRFRFADPITAEWKVRGEWGETELVAGRYNRLPAKVEEIRFTNHTADFAIGVELWVYP
ncbi:MAG TPA: hypothetical protein VKB93_21305 [Thermoanaerobaculia bacterium]|nr:hypothetical protein [Thermoanaerobaculia bacterium]